MFIITTKTFKIYTYTITPIILYIVSISHLQYYTRDKMENNNNYNKKKKIIFT